MATLSDISVSLIEGRKDTYQNEFIPDLAEALKPGSTQANGEYLQECPDFDIRDALAVSERHPGLLVELDVKGEYEEDSCRVRLRGSDHELIQKQYPRFEKLLSSREGAASDPYFFSHLDLEQADRRALAFLHTHIKKEITINGDLPATNSSWYSAPPTTTASPSTSRPSPSKAATSASRESTPPPASKSPPTSMSSPQDKP